MEKAITIEVDRDMGRHNPLARPEQLRSMARIKLFLWANRIMTESKLKYVPVDTGMLRSTGHVNLPVTKGTSVEVTEGFGGPAAPYAYRQHECLTYRHKVGMAKYLEKPTLLFASAIGADIAASAADINRGGP